jgi:hypothetical protein
MICNVIRLRNRLILLLETGRLSPTMQTPTLDNVFFRIITNCKPNNWFYIILCHLTVSSLFVATWNDVGFISSEATTRSVIQEVRRFLRNSIFHWAYCVNKFLPLHPVLKQMNAVYIFTHYFSEIHLSISNSPTPRFPKYLFASSFRTILSLQWVLHDPLSTISRIYLNDIWWRVQIINILFTQFSPPSFMLSLSHVQVFLAFLYQTFCIYVCE